MSARGAPYGHARGQMSPRTSPAPFGCLQTHGGCGASMQTPSHRGVPHTGKLHTLPTGALWPRARRCLHGQPRRAAARAGMKVRLPRLADSASLFKAACAHGLSASPALHAYVAEQARCCSHGQQRPSAAGPHTGRMSPALGEYTCSAWRDATAHARAAPRMPGQAPRRRHKCGRARGSAHAHATFAGPRHPGGARSTRGMHVQTVGRRPTSTESRLEGRKSP